MRTRFFLLLTVLVACADPGPDGTPADAEEGPGAYVDDFETSGDFFTFMAGPVDGASVHGTVQIWYSSNLRSLIESGEDFTAPLGSVAIKVQDNGAESITVMVKEEPGFAPDHSDWSWEQRGIDGTLTNSGALAGCQGCHADYADTDYLAGTELQ
jgi:hypothetical protein